MKELTDYNPLLAQKDMIVLLTKADLATKDELKNKLKILKKLNKKTYPISIHDWDSLEALKKLLSS